MQSNTVQPPGAKPESTPGKASFFAQSTWLMVVNILGGMLMWSVHLLAKKTGPEEYGIFGAFLALAMCIPTMPLQMVVTQQTAKALATGSRAELAGIVRWAWIGTFVVWLVGAVAALIFQQDLMQKWHLGSPVTIWIALGIVLFSLWCPIFWGVLQGKQDFFWFGWTAMANGMVRLGVAGAAVWLGQKAAGMLFGVVLGFAVAWAIALWKTRDIWGVRAARFDLMALVRQTFPLVLGFAAFQFIFTADTMFTKAYFDEATVGFYVAAGTMSRALMWLVGPLVSVMFPRLVHSAARSEKSNLMGLVLLGTAVLSIGGTVCLSILGPWLVRLIYKPEYVDMAAQLLPWYSGAMVPLALANVLLSSLMARGIFKIVPALCVMAVVYGFAITRFHETPVMVLQTLAVCNTVLAGVCAWFSWIARHAAGSLEPAHSGM